MRFIRSLILLCLLWGSVVLAQPARTIDFGDTISDQLSSNVSAVEYTFTGEQGQFVSITMLQVVDMDPFLRLLDASGNVLIEDDDSAGSLNAKIGPYRLPTNGSYTIVATSLSGDDVGDFTLNLETTVVQRIEYGQTITGTLDTDNPEEEYLFTTAAGDTISIDLESTAFDSYLTLASTNPRMDLTYDDDSGVDRNARIGPYVLADGGEYNITVSSVFDPNGEYTLTLNKVDLTPITLNEALDAQISGGQARYFSFEGRAGQVIDVRVDSGNKLDTALTVYGPSSNEVASADDVDNKVDPSAVNVLLSEDGTYFLAVQPNISRDARTPITVKVAESRVPSLDSGPQTVQLDTQGGSHILSFTASEGEHVRLRLMIEASEAMSPNVRVTQGGSEIASLSSYTISDEISFGVALPQDGPVTLELIDYN
ncbi:MAG: PPC domain-containing protein, partial [Anaerolineae bacterium]|nr:PPC domain-containing protein [Anaerolineae bacterium]